MPKAHIFIDAEYCFAAALRDGKIPNYKSLIGHLSALYKNCRVYAYFVGSRAKKKSVCDFLIRIGADYVQTIETFESSKLQIIGTTIALDVAKLLLHGEDDERFVFVSGDDYLIPIIQMLQDNGNVTHVYHFPLPISSDLKKMNCKLEYLSSCFVMTKDDKHQRSN